MRMKGVKVVVVIFCEEKYDREPWSFYALGREDQKSGFIRAHAMYRCCAVGSVLPLDTRPFVRVANSARRVIKPSSKVTLKSESVLYSIGSVAS